MPRSHEITNMQNGFWRKVALTLATDEDLVAKFNAIDLMEAISPYKSAGQPYFARVIDALSYIPHEMHEAALVIFANVVYLPRPLMEDAWRYLWTELLRTETSNVDGGLASEMCFFEVDEAGMSSRFAHINNIQRRLDTDVYPRTRDIDGVLALLFNLLCPIETIQRTAKEELRKMLTKKYWVVLVDKSLSGQSLAKDLERFATVAKIAEDAGWRLPRIPVLIQVLTNDAEQFVSESLKCGSETLFDLRYALRFDDGFKVNSPSCKLIRNPTNRERVKDLCEWFADAVLKADSDFDRMRERSGDNLAHGYRACGLTVVDYDNCPTDSLPLLWYASANAHKRRYVGPFPRTHSRLGKQKREAAEEKWQAISNRALLDQIIRILSELRAEHA